MGKQATVRGGWRQWTTEDGRRALSKWEASGLPLATWAKRHGIGTERLRWWKTRLAGPKAAADERPAFVPAVMTGALAVTATAAVTLHLPGGVLLEVSDTAAVSADWFAAVAAKLSRAG